LAQNTGVTAWHNVFVFEPVVKKIANDKELFAVLSNAF